MLAGGLFPCGQEASAEWGGVVGLSGPATPPVLNPTTTDTDGDGMLNTWEDANSLNKLDPKDAMSDFDIDGLTAMQEFELSGRTGGQYGKPTGSWSASYLPIPSGFVSNPSVTLIECAGNGTVLARVSGTLTGDPGPTAYPYTYSPATGVWTRVGAPVLPNGTPSVVSLTPLDVNSSGQVVGYFNSGGTKGFVWTPPASGSGGTTEVFYLEGLSAIPKRISDSGYITGTKSSLGGTSFAGTVNGYEIHFQGMLPNPTYLDVNNYGEFIGTAQGMNFLATHYGPVFPTGFTAEALEELVGVWGDIPDIDPDSIVWSATFGYGGFRTGTVLDRTTNASVNVREGYGASFYWESSYAYYSGYSQYYYSYPGFSQVFGAINDWGEFAGLYTGSMNYTVFDSYNSSQPFSNSTTDSGIFFFEGEYHASKVRPSIYGASNDGRVLLGTPYALWSGRVVVPIPKIMPAGFPASPYAVRLADRGSMVAQLTGSPALLVVKPDQDADEDGMPDDWEEYYGFDPNNASDAALDADGDEVTNLTEFKYRTNPTLVPVPGSPGQFIDIRPGIDTDGDGMPNVWEWKHGFNYEEPSDASADPDDDSLTNLKEFRLGTDPKNADTDYDEMLDGWEVANGLNPSDETDAALDLDGDGVSNVDEIANETNPRSKTDLDNDGLPGDWEKWWAAQILASGIELTTSQRDELLVGNVNPTVEAFGDGTTNAEQFEVSQQVAAVGDSVTPYRIRGKERGIWGELWAHEDYEWCGIPGLANGDVRGRGYLSESYCPPAGWVVPSASQINQELTLRAPWNSVEWQDFNIDLSTITEMQNVPSGLGYTYTQFKEYNRIFKLIYSEISRESRTAEFLKVTTKWSYPVAGEPVQTCEMVQLTVPPNSTTSQDVEVKPTLAPGEETEISLFKVVVQDDITATGVDDVSIRAVANDPGHQNQVWIMAPISRTNTVRFRSGASASIQIHLSAENATFTPDILNSEDQLVAVTGKGAETTESSLLLKIGTTEVVSSIKVKAMKKRNVKVAIHKVGLIVEPPDPPLVIPALDVIETYLDSVFLTQVNADIAVTAASPQGPLGWDMGKPSNYPALIGKSGVEGLYEKNGRFDFTSAEGLEREDKYINDVLRDENVDINVYLVTRHFTAWGVLGDSAIGFTGAVGITRRTPNVIVIDAKQKEIMNTIAHEIGHCMINYGHPDMAENSFAATLSKLPGAPPLNRGPAPHDGVGAKEWEKRLMYSTTLPVPGKTTVKSEWDAAEIWLKNRSRGDN